MPRSTRSFTVLATLCALGCGGGSTAIDAGRDAPPAIDAAPIPLADLEVSITSSESGFAGKVRVGAFRMSPPTMPPLALSVLDAPSFPTTTTLRDLEPGTYWVIGVLDVDPPSVTLPGPEDTTATSAAITITGEETAPIPVAIDLPAPATP